MKVFELKKRKNLSHAIHAIALVESPAIEEDFIYLSKYGTKATNIHLSEEKGLIYSPVLIPNQRIKRLNKQNEEYEIFFSAETIEEAAYDLMTAKALDNFNSEHNSDNKIHGNNIVELWIVEDPEMDKSTKLGFNVPKGTLMAAIKITDENVKKDIKLGKYKGISIEGLFEDFELVEDTNLKSNITMSEVKADVKSLITKLSSLFKDEVKLAKVETDKGFIYAKSFTEGSEMFSDEAMTTPLMDGDYTAGEVRYVVRGGQLSSLDSVKAPDEGLDRPSEMFQELAETSAKASIELSEKVTQLESENEKLKEDQNKLTTKLSEVESLLEEHKVLLSKVKEFSEVESKVELKSELQEVELKNLEKFNY